MWQIIKGKSLNNIYNNISKNYGDYKKCLENWMYARKGDIIYHTSSAATATTSVTTTTTNNNNYKKLY